VALTTKLFYQTEYQNCLSWGSSQIIPKERQCVSWQLLLQLNFSKTINQSTSTCVKQDKDLERGAIEKERESCKNNKGLITKGRKEEKTETPELIAKRTGTILKRNERKGNQILARSA
jgi:hypothetical protein